MKHLLTISALLVSSLAMGQWPSLPYNPDDNADGLIGVADLQALLANYGSEFASAVVSEDGESAIVYMGEMDYFSCDYGCTQLPGMWQLPNARDLVPVYDVLHASTSYTYTWVNRDDFVETLGPTSFPFYVGRSTFSDRYLATTGSTWQTYSCYCAAKQLPRVEYSHCSGGAPSEEAFDQCINEKLSEGWYPLSGFPSDFTSDGYGNFIGGGTQDKRVLPEKQSHASFWRWAE